MPRRKLDLSSGVKTCPRCKETKALDQFHKSSDTLHGYQVYCKLCQNAKHKEWSDAKPDIKEYRAKKAQEWRDRNPEKAKDHKRRSTYGMELGDYAKLLESQGGRCAILAQHRSHWT